MRLSLNRSYITRDGYTYAMFGRVPDPRNPNRPHYQGRRADGSTRLFDEKGFQVGSWNKNNGHVCKEA